MKKRKYFKPTMEIVNIKKMQIICSSPNPPQQWPYPGA